MRQEDNLKEKYGTDTGFRVPNGYFDSLDKRIMESLPPYPEAPRQRSLSQWERLKPYIYLAAMFCGIWLMMKVFHNVSDSGRLNLDNPPNALVQLVETDSWENYWEKNSEPEFYLEDEVIDNYDSIEDFENDFGYTLKPEYSNLQPLATTGA